MRNALHCRALLEAVLELLIPVDVSQPHTTAVPFPANSCSGWEAAVCVLYVLFIITTAPPTMLYHRAASSDRQHV
jgi:hypothetical protein